MLCQVCQQNEMVMKITKIQGGVPTEYNVCAECAAKISAHHAAIQKKRQVDKQTVENLLKDLLGQAGATKIKITHAADEDVPSCPECGINYLQYRQSFMLGCPACYDSFGEVLENDIQKIHRATHHVSSGSRPQPRAASSDVQLDLQTQVRMLQRELQESIECENFDRAAELRDEINALQQQIESEKNE